MYNFSQKKPTPDSSTTFGSKLPFLRHRLTVPPAPSRLPPLFATAFLFVSVCFSLGLTGCPKGTPSHASEETPLGAEQETICYFGETTAYRPDGENLGAIKTIVRRSVQPSENPGRGKIIEEVANIDPRPDMPNRFYNVVLEVEGDRFTMRETGGSFTGKGRLFGPAWRWNRWNSESIMTQGGKVVSEDVLENGRLNADKKYYGPDGKLLMVFKESLERIDEETCKTYWESAKQNASSSP